MRLENTHQVKWLTGSGNKLFTIGLRYTIVLIPEEKIPAALEELKIAMKEQIGTQLYVRYQVIYMLLSGESYEKIGAYTGLSQATLLTIAERIVQKESQGLEEKTARSPTIFNT